MRAPHKYHQRIAAITAVAAAVGLLAGAVFPDIDGADDPGRSGGNARTGSVIEAPATTGRISSGPVRTGGDDVETVHVALAEGAGRAESAEALGRLLPWLAGQVPGSGSGRALPKVLDVA
ncbi:hypothetical protein [Streptomyces sp. G-G2]|uniref:hypothetical protein n=1 Tax=Streptomyces sp. G-G2 TaxID=3046201 RepID=UPI0024BB1DEB|nr:hypothetical protein [Streptomyces sp. G-G2]MDJ0382938.1 hypothetical protein [Streptomyces sp. G-G2]